MYSESIEPDPYTQSSSGVFDNRPWWFWALVGCGVLFFCCLCACIVSFGGLVWLGSLEPENVAFAHEAPQTMTLGTESYIDIYIDNTADEGQAVSSIRVDLTLLEGITILDSTPAFTGEPSDFMDSVSYYYEIELEPGTSETITLSIMPDAVGEYSGEIFVCMNIGFACEVIAIQFEVME